MREATCPVMSGAVMMTEAEQDILNHDKLTTLKRDTPGF